MLDLISFHTKHFSNRPEDTVISAIVIGHTNTKTALERMNWFDTDESEYSVHYIIDDDGKIYECVPVDMKAWFCPKVSLHNVENVNEFAVGIELVGIPDNVHIYQDMQLNSLIELCTSLCASYTISLNRVVGYEDVCMLHNRKNDPYVSTFPWFEFLNTVACRVMEQTLLTSTENDGGS